MSNVALGVKYAAYPEYKDSGVEWLDDIPKSWCTGRLKHMLEVPMSYGANEAAERAVYSEPRYIRITDMRSDGSLKEDTFRSLPREIANDYLLKDRDILLARSGATVGKSFIYRKEFGDCCFAGYLIKASCDSTRLNSDYAFWFFQSSSYWQYISGSQIQATIQNVSAEKYGEMYISLPDHIEEQTQIANFLDHETAKIDTLIDKQQQLIKLLKEKRQAVISHAVTKGLNPQAPMKDSGLEWLGEVPQHWRPKSIKRLFKQRKQQNNVGYEVLSVYREFGVILKSSRSDNHNKTPDDLSSYQLVNKGCLVINKMKAWQGSLGVSDLEGITSPDYVVYESIHSESNKFLHFLLRRQEMPNVYRAISNGIRPSQWRLEPEKFEDLVLFLPSLEEQLEVVKAIEKEVLVYEQLISKCASATKLMEERKSALISAAVTGKIDVRNWRGNKLAYEDGYCDAV
ncbi:restriction endonuclease subunit S [Enterovibrio norvegicus]|uniref:restriction endonuclease subunit S n=1 Tax=Enterovibrio norvegicus TaxID=188144 RepID=UPI0010BED3A0|nr:restriction endonuclease subunit S [Enterovibrio norvegicus]TKF31301.1 restriction endonuclease subunit S [Enterovibrio norvegicus]